MPTVTIGLPVFNGELLIRQTLESILQQTFADFELLIGDNASTDSTLGICAEFASRDPRIRILTSETNKGAAPNYNRLVHEAAGRYFRWQPHDDLIAPTFLEQCVGYLEAHPSIILCYPSTCAIDENGKPFDRKPEDTLDVTAAQPAVRLRQYFESSFLNRQCNAVLGVVRTHVLRTTGLIGPYTASDKILLTELALRGPFHQLPEALFFRRYHSQGSLAVHPNPAERDGWFDSHKRNRRAFVQWKWFAANIGAIHRAPLSIKESFASYLQMWRYFILYRYALKNELKEFLRTHLSGPNKGEKP
jgi:glycosyltransferase involved in cell wall biosynthesis